MQNRIRELRTKRGLTQEELAERSRTTEEQIQRVEGGVQAARLSVAAAIAEALDTSVAEAFPEIVPYLKRMEQAKRRGDDPPDDEDFFCEAEAAGIDLDTRIWTVLYELRCGFSGRYTIGSRDRVQLLTDLESFTEDDAVGFWRFDSGPRRILLDLSELSLCRLCFDVDFGLISSSSQYEEDANEEDFSVVFYLKSGGAPITVGLEPCAPLIEPPPFLPPPSGDECMLSFVDADDEPVFVRTRDIALIDVALAAVEPGARAAED